MKEKKYAHFNLGLLTCHLLNLSVTLIWNLTKIVEWNSVDLFFSDSMYRVDMRRIHEITQRNIVFSIWCKAARKNFYFPQR
jgi:hypothetical protein